MEFGLFAILLLCVTVLYFVLCLDLRRIIDALMDRDSNAPILVRAADPHSPNLLHHSFPSLQQSEPNWESALNVIWESIYLFESLPCFRMQAWRYWLLQGVPLPCTTY